MIQRGEKNDGDSNVDDPIATVGAVGGAGTAGLSSAARHLQAVRQKRQSRAVLEQRLRKRTVLDDSGRCGFVLLTFFYAKRQLLLCFLFIIVKGISDSNSNETDELALSPLVDLINFPAPGFEANIEYNCVQVHMLSKEDIRFRNMITDVSLHVHIF